MKFTLLAQDEAFLRWIYPLFNAGSPEETVPSTRHLPCAAAPGLAGPHRQSEDEEDDGEVQHCALLSSFLSLSSNTLGADATRICRGSPVLGKAMTNFSPEDPTFHTT